MPRLTQSLPNKKESSLCYKIYLIVPKKQLLQHVADGPESFERVVKALGLKGSFITAHAKAFQLVELCTLLSGDKCKHFE